MVIRYLTMDLIPFGMMFLRSMDMGVQSQSLFPKMDRTGKCDYNP